MNPLPVLAVAALAAAAHAAEDSGLRYGELTRVVDGDTVDIDGERHRLVLVDTPERGQPGFGEAADFVAERCMGKTISYNTNDPQPLDRYGRHLSLVYCDGPGSPSINELLVRAGHSGHYTRFCDESEFAGQDWTGCPVPRALGAGAPDRSAEPRPEPAAPVSVPQPVPARSLEDCIDAPLGFHTSGDNAGADAFADLFAGFLLGDLDLDADPPPYRDCYDLLWETAGEATGAGLIPERAWECTGGLPREPAAARAAVGLYADCVMPLLAGTGEYAGLGPGICTTEVMSLVSPHFMEDERYFLMVFCYEEFGTTPCAGYGFADIAQGRASDSCTAEFDRAVAASAWVMPDGCLDEMAAHYPLITDDSLECVAVLTAETGANMGYGMDEVCAQEVFYGDERPPRGQLGEVLERCRGQFGGGGFWAWLFGF